MVSEEPELKYGKENILCKNCGHIVQYNPYTKKIQHFGYYKQYNILADLPIEICTKAEFGNTKVSEDEAYKGEGYIYDLNNDWDKHKTGDIK